MSRKARNFFPEFNIRLYDKNSESDYFFFPPPKSKYFFQQHWESEYFFLEKVKWSVPNEDVCWTPLYEYLCTTFGGYLYFYFGWTVVFLSNH